MHLKMAADHSVAIFNVIILRFIFVSNSLNSLIYALTPFLTPIFYEIYGVIREYIEFCSCDNPLFIAIYRDL